MLSDEEARLFALEWLVRRVAADQCLMSSNPSDAALMLVTDARSIEKALAAHDPGEPEVTASALALIGATVELAESVSEAVHKALS